MYSDPIADYLTRIRNAVRAGHRVLEMPSSRLKERMTEVLKDRGFVSNYKFIPDNKQGILKIALRRDPVTKKAAIVSLSRVSRPGLRKYVGLRDMPRVLNGLGIAILSTSKGVMSNKEALKRGLGGEVLCYVY
ncbi:MAG: 30S ribosomal protein S8 [Cytophagales bacterium]|nr:30S ribosomal protein S8 [Cytophagales bacterium]